MTKYGFVIDQRKCIGCHACTVACKSENQVPLGSFRTWVKYIEKGAFPNTRRFFTIERCQHCEDAPCVTICPTKSLYKRKDGIVDFEPDRCIGCKSCMQACPYDALYIDPNSHTAAKCHYCAHRTDRGLLPACVIVCPTKAIIAGDLEDGSSEIVQTLAREQVQVRRPDQGTRPQVFYVGADEYAITPGLAVQPSSYMWAELGPQGVELEPKGAPLEVASGEWRVASAGRGDGETGGRGDGAMESSATADFEHVTRPLATTVYDVAHPVPWGWKVSTYLWTKSIAAGSLLVGGLMILIGLETVMTAIVASALAVLFAAATSGLLVWDLKRPERFWRVVFTPNPTSWLTWGAYVLIAFTLVSVLWFLASLSPTAFLPPPLVVLGMLLAVATAGYSAFLFGQAEGRDFWQGPLLLWHLLAAALVAGSAVLLLLSVIVIFIPEVAFSQVAGLFVFAGPADLTLLFFLSWLLPASLALAAVVTLTDLLTPHSNKDVAMAVSLLTRGPLMLRFWLGYGLAGVVVPIALGVMSAGFFPSLLPAAGVAAVLALAGLWLYEDLWIRAGQSVPMS